MQENRIKLLFCCSQGVGSTLSPISSILLCAVHGKMVRIQENLLAQLCFMYEPKKRETNAQAHCSPGIQKINLLKGIFRAIEQIKRKRYNRQRFELMPVEMHPISLGYTQRR